ncbi:amino acid transporter AVT1D-like isoform X1 [Salvia divinorum]|uniref:Amino acid transporter AVT1D-like isoform X1 n=1 Tax=Salvia divinorum TaxID=28513 RepID=A0ABD1GYM6_SALDI
MKQLEEEFGMDRAIEIETDDEDDEAERVCHDNDDDNESDITGLSRVPSHDFMDPDIAPSWPQSYRQSMDMYTSVTPSVSFIKGGSFLIQTDRRSQAPDIESSLSKSLLSATNSDIDIVPTSIPPIKLSSVSVFGASISELPMPQQCSYSQSLLNATNALCGIGILSTPFALKEGGWIGILLLFLFGIIACFTGILLKRCLESSSQLQTYPDIGQAAFGLGGRICIAIILYIELYSSCVEFLIMMSDNLSATFPNAHLDISGIHLDSYQTCAIVATLVILPTVWLRNLSMLSYVSICGVMTLILVVLCLVWVGVVSDFGFNPSGKALNFSHLPITIGIYSFCYGGHSVFPNIYSSMENPSQFPSILAISFAISCLLYAGVAVLGFLMFGEATDPQFTLNLPTRLIASRIAGWAVVVAPLTKFGLSMTPVALALEELLPSDQLASHTMPILIRTSLVVSTLVVALTVPYFGSMMALIGSLLIMLMSLVLPCACYMRIEQGRLTKFQITVCSIVMGVGICCAAIGTYSAVASMGT